jgi:hypothetical protein
MNSTQEINATVERISARFRRGRDVRELLTPVVYRLVGTPQRKAAFLKKLKIGGPIAAVLLGVGAYFVFRPTPQPDYLRARLDKVFNYTLLTDEFNNLPVEKRMELIGQLVQRMKSMSVGDSTVLAAFAAGIAGAARQQIEENASRLAIDLWDKYALDYAAVPEGDRGAYLDDAFINFVKLMGTVAGEPPRKSDSELLTDARAQAKRDNEALDSGRGRPPAEALGRAFTFLNGNVGGHATPAQRARGQLMMRDMVRRMRGEDLEKGPR